mmetsp:Transcript_9898/g.19432  ORF Transcript_9898/g.19432 Transcript_9898/m.19432 type:complete len:203 (+) Transcript_9898:266-874(+)
MFSLTESRTKTCSLASAFSLSSGICMKPRVSSTRTGAPDAKVTNMFLIAGLLSRSLRNFISSGLFFTLSITLMRFFRVLRLPVRSRTAALSSSPIASVRERTASSLDDMDAMGAGSRGEISLSPEALSVDASNASRNVTAASYLCISSGSTSSLSITPEETARLAASIAEFSLLKLAISAALSRSTLSCCIISTIAAACSSA